MSLQRGMSLPPETRANTLPRGTRDTMSMSRDVSPSNIRHQRRRSGVYSKFGQELPSSLVSSFTKPKNQSPFTGIKSWFPALVGSEKDHFLFLTSSFSGFFSLYHIINADNNLYSNCTTYMSRTHGSI